MNVNNSQLDDGLPDRPRRMHENSLEAYRKCKPSFGSRAQLILAWMSGRGAMTDRQVMEGLGFQDPNAVRPRITELVEAGEILEVGKTVEGGRHVRLVKLVVKQLELIS